MIKAGVYGATGYTGLELVRLLEGHPEVELSFLTSESYSGSRLSDVFAGAGDFELIPSTRADTGQVDAVFTCLPHTTAMELIAGVYRPGLRIVDLSADFRFRDAAAYEKWYDTGHRAVDLLEKSAYGLPEFFRDEIRNCEIVGNPGCYPTSVLLALGPLAMEGLLRDADLAIDSKSGVSGAGRKPGLTSHFVEVNENVIPYKVGRVHRHVGEMEGVLTGLAGHDVRVAFTPQLVPLTRGILSTIYVRCRVGVDRIRQLYEGFYAEEPFVKVLPGGNPAHLGHVRHNNDCVIGIHEVGGTGLVLITSAIDNLLKGAAGQAVQNFNILFGLDEKAGLSTPGGRV